LLLLVLSIYLTPVREAFGTEALDAATVAIVAGLAVTPAALTEAVELVLRRRRGRADAPAAVA
jgi:hypothetical protein